MLVFFSVVRKVSWLHLHSHLWVCVLEPAMAGFEDEEEDEVLDWLPEHVAGAVVTFPEVTH